jgi:hypothetical protein
MIILRGTLERVTCNAEDLWLVSGQKRLKKVTST